MVKNHEVSVYFSTNAISDLCHAPPYNFEGFQTNDVIELESFKQTYI